jgi:hypothetical protein
MAMRRRQSEREDRRETFLLASYEPQDIRSIQALALYAQGAERPWPKGEEPPVPTPYDVKQALDWIVHKAAMTYENASLIALMAGDPDMAPFIDGKRSVGQQLVKLMTLKPAAFDKDAPRNAEGVGPQGEQIKAREI